MADPSFINLSSLPWLPLDAKSAFPRNPAIYFAVDSQGVVQYIGRSVDPKNRWANHHRYKELEAIGRAMFNPQSINPLTLPSVSFLRASAPPYNTLYLFCNQFSRGSSIYWANKKVKETEATLRKIEEVLGADFGVRFDN